MEFPKPRRNAGDLALKARRVKTMCELSCEDVQELMVYDVAVESFLDINAHWTLKIFRTRLLKAQSSTKISAVRKTSAAATTAE